MNYFRFRDGKISYMQNCHKLEALCSLPQAVGG